MNVYLFSNITLGYGSPQYIYFLRSLEERGGYDTHSVEIYEEIRKPYKIENFDTKRIIVGESLKKPLAYFKTFRNSYKASKYLIRPVLKLLLQVSTIKIILGSYFNKVIVITTYDSKLFAFLSKNTLIIQNFTEIWNEEYTKKCGNLTSSYRDSVNICISPQIDRLEIAKSIYKNATHLLAHNAPPKYFSPDLLGGASGKCVLYQGRIGDLTLANEIISFANFIDQNTVFHIAGIVEDAYKSKLAEVAKRSNVFFHGFINAEDLKSIRDTCNIGLVSWSNETLNTKFAAPNKLYEHMASGHLVISLENYSISSMNDIYNFGFIEATGKELAFRLNDSSDSLVNDYGKSNHDTFIRELNYENQMEAVFKEIDRSLKNLG